MKPKRGGKDAGPGREASAPKTGMGKEKAATFQENILA
jgi:hypothetical protein